MANTIVSTGTVRATFSSMTVTTDIGFTTVLTGSNMIADTKNIGISSWEALNTSSLTDLKWIIASNEGTGSIQLARDAAGTNIIAIMEPYDAVVIPWSGSIQSSTLYAKATPSQSILQYVVSER